MDIVLALLAGLLLGIAMSYRRPVGYLRVDRSDRRAGPFLFLELNTPIAGIIRKRNLRLKVRVKDFIPQE